MKTKTNNNRLAGKMLIAMIAGIIACSTGNAAIKGSRKEA